MMRCVGPLVLFFLLMVMGCATIVCGSKQKIPVITDPEGAHVIVNSESQITPAVLLLDRKQPDYTVRIEKEGYAPVEITLQRSENGWVWGNILFGGIIGLTIDMATGAVYKHTPSKIEVTLAEQQLSWNGKTKDMLFVKLKKF